MRRWYEIRQIEAKIRHKIRHFLKYTPDGKVCERIGNNQKRHLPGTASAEKVEAAGIEPASRDVSTKASTCVVGDLNFAQPTGHQHPEIQTS